MGYGAVVSDESANVGWNRKDSNTLNVDPTNICVAANIPKKGPVVKNAPRSLSSCSSRSLSGLDRHKRAVLFVRSAQGGV